MRQLNSIHEWIDKQKTEWMCEDVDDNDAVSNWKQRRSAKKIFKFAMLIIPFRFHINRKKFTMARNKTESIDFVEGTLSSDDASVSLRSMLF